MSDHIGDMSAYRRVRIPGATYFFTVALARRPSCLLTDQIGPLRRAYAQTMQSDPVFCDAMVILPDHLHAVWTLPPGDSDYSGRWRKIKSRFSRRCRIDLPRSPSKRAKRERGIWQRRFWEHTIRDEKDYQAHVAYCCGNPVKHGLVERAADWPFSSIHRDIRAGRVDHDWRGVEPEGLFGE